MNLRHYLWAFFAFIICFLPSLCWGQAPTFTSFGSTTTSGNSSLVINGNNFLSTTSVRFGDIPAKFIVNSNSRITATVPYTANTGRVRITRSNGNVLTTSIPVTRTSPANVFSLVSD
ncbi:MAG: IPT/TIG domain-containing protein, partial [Flexibacteraceae bacterium]